MHTAVMGLTLFTGGIISLSVIEEKIMEKSSSCGGTGIEPEFPTKDIAVIRDIDAVLETCSRDMMPDKFQLFQFVGINDIGNAVVVTAKGEVFF